MIQEKHKKRLKKLAGIVSESEEFVDANDASFLRTGIGMILKLKPEYLNKVISLDVPEVDLTTNQNMSKLSSDNIHVTLNSIKNFKPFKNDFKDYVLPQEIDLPNIQIGECKFVYRPDSNKVTYVMALSNQEEFKKFVDNVYKSLGLENPEPDRFYHITIANNEGGNPFKSIGDVTKKDFNK